MSYLISRRFFLSASAATLATGAVADAPDGSLRPRLRGKGFAKKAVAQPEVIVADAKLGGQVCFAVADAKTGLRLEAMNPQTGTPPASTAKAITALYALDVLGGDHRFETQVVATGTVSDGVVAGDLVLLGGGDPSLDTNGLATLAANVKAAGIREVRGDLVIYDGGLVNVSTIDPDQPAHVGYSPAVSGIALNYNRVHFEWKRSGGKYAVTMDARSDKYRPAVAVAQMRIADRSAPVYTYAESKGRDDWTVAKAALGSGGARWLPVRKPGLYAGDVFRTMLRSQGIVVPAAKVTGMRPSGQVVARLFSDDLRVLLKDMLKYSTNLTAEMVGLAATVKRGVTPVTLRDSAAAMNDWAQQVLGVQGIALVDHSGLSEDSRVTADGMVGALVKVYANNELRPLLKEIPLRDAKGRPIKSGPISVHAKTGTLNFVSGLAGYMTAHDGTVMAFSIYAADEPRRAKLTKAQRERPEGARWYNGRAKNMQQDLIERWGALYGS
ncbi:D-alanyl-D-alanine carboxypeptidase/D-alanyl-D-alanine-endopeptidase [Pseudosulfitobacter sp. DSM 107133]|uniref:D-alanyl-D-alanine carboxypeptidase/D-alanyl-D-alanine endopeptidase n=1 Tax=Pseudosulfitobacter sp. DSM 107133 TaxID=2883100 RepID=UPI000DF33B3D|nr:D-alanyl-D-alanine carboxypeptidase/D-alanyl-D-alanine-endopeptidase [Pseudosulfitobacter sp. DSM 107133]UOA25800.1 D-alanyl-D-alanine carboxypeptidase DacB [Pseudosulfitobacter sp. DSM 107133]